MSTRRLELQNILEDFVGNKNVYYQPPNNLTLQYPCIVYVRDDSVVQHADNHPYFFEQRYQVTLIHRDPDNPILDKLNRFPKTRFNRTFTADHLIHDVYNLHH